MNVHAEPIIPGIATADPPRILVNYAHDWVGMETTPSTSVAITVAGKATITGMADGDGRFFADNGGGWNPAPPDIEPGDVITASAGGMTTTVNPVGAIDIEADFDTDTVSGAIHASWFSPTLLTVHCAIWEEGGPDIEITGVDPDGGSYSCDFSTVGWDLQKDQRIAATYEEPDGDTVINIFAGSWVRVNYGHDWVGADYELGHTFRITVTDSADAIKATAQKDTSAGGGWGGDGFQTDWEDWQPEGPDISPGDWVYFKADDGYANTLRVGEISGTVDLDADSISGPIYADWFSQALEVECHPWGGWPGPAQVKFSTAEPDGSVPYSCQWGPGEWDVQPGQEIAVFYAVPGARDLVGTVLFGTATRYVATTGSDGGPNACLDPAAPCKTIGHTLSQATRGDSVWIAEGTYVETLTVSNTTLLLRGGYAISGSQWTPNQGETTIDGGKAGRVILIHDESDITLEDLTITGGKAPEDQCWGGGIWVTNADLTIRSSVIRDNRAECSGGAGAGIELNEDEGPASLTVRESVLTGNVADQGGAINTWGGDVTLINTVVTHNSKNSLVASNGSQVSIQNSTLSNNAEDGPAAAIFGSGAFMIENSIVWGTPGGSLACDDGTCTVTHSNIEGGWSGTGNIDADPLFVDSANDDYHLQSDSPCIDSGTNANAPDHDLDGTLRPQDGDNDGSAVTDMGAYEFEFSRIYLPVVANSTAGG